MRKHWGSLNEHGMALGLAVVALVVIGGLVAAALLVGVPEHRVGRNTIKLEQAFTAAQEGAHTQVASWGGGSPYNRMIENNSATFGGTLGQSSGWYRGTVTRLNGSLFLVESEGFSVDSQARQKVGLLVRLRPYNFNINAAVTIQGVMTVAGNPVVDGNDHIPTGWACGPLQPPEAGVRLRATSDVTTKGSPKVLGSPPVEPDPTITSSSLMTFGDGLDFDAVAKMATKVLNASTYTGIGPAFNGDGSCNTAKLENFGDPKNPASRCGSYFPIIFVKGTGSVSKFSTGVGQGILLVEGDLSLTGNFEFFGPIIVKGAFSLTGGGNKINGALIAANGSTIDNTIGGSANVNYSACALEKSLQANAPGVPLRERSWAEIP